MNAVEFVKAAISLSVAGVTAAAVINHVINRQRNRRVDTVSRLVEVCGAGTRRQAVVNVLRQLESSGFGTFVIGRRGQESRFIWREV